MRIIYADSLFFLNFLVDYLLLAASARLCSLPVRRRRWAAGAAFGGCYAVAAVVWPVPFSLVTVKLLAGAVTALAGLGTARAGRSIVSFFALSAGFGGVVCALCSLAGLESTGVYIPVSFPVLLGAFAVCYAAVSLVFRQRVRSAGRRIIPVTLSLGESSITVPALADTGNELRDPVTGLPVIVVQAETAEELFPPAARPWLYGDAVTAVERLRELDCPGAPRLIFCRSAGSASSALACFSLKEARVEGKRRQLCLAVTAVTLSEDGDYTALVNPE